MKAHEALRAGKVAVIPTDTLYGLVARALDKDAVERVYALKNRTPDKPVIILISSKDQLGHFGVAMDARVDTHWPGPVSIILPCDREDLHYLHRGTYSLAFRMPDKLELVELIAQTGPLVAPSANPEGSKPASTIEEAYEYFGDEVAHYMPGGSITGKPSKLIRLTEAGIEILRS